MSDMSEEQRMEWVNAIKASVQQQSEFKNGFVTHLGPETIQRNQKIRDLVEFAIPIFATLLELDKDVSPTDRLARKAVSCVLDLVDAATDAVDSRGKNEN
jgi:hypothetical protein